MMHERFPALDARYSATELAEILGVTPRTIVRWRRDLGTSRPNPGTPRPSSDRDKVKQLLEEGCSIRETARTVGVSQHTVRRWFPEFEPWTSKQASEWAIMHRRLNVL